MKDERKYCACGFPQSDFPYHEHSREREIVRETAKAIGNLFDDGIDYTGEEIRNIISKKF